MKPDLQTATQGQPEAGPALTEISPCASESFLAPEHSTDFDGCESQANCIGTKPKEAVATVPAVTTLPQGLPVGAPDALAKAGETSGTAECPEGSGLGVGANPQPISSVEPVGESPTGAPESGALPIEGRSTNELTEALRRSAILARIDALVAAGCPIGDAREQAGISAATYSRWRARLAARGSLIPDRHKSGRRRALELNEAEERVVKDLYQRSNKDKWSGSMRTTAKFLAHHPDTRDEVRGKILAALECSSRVPGFIKRVLERVTKAHTQQRRQPKNAASQFAGTVGAFFGDKNDRRRVIESDDGTVNFVGWLPWPMGGDRCSDKFGVRIGRWQFLPAMEAGWSHFMAGYQLVCRPRGSYREEDIRSLIHLVARAHGLPDEFRFERGSWEANNVVNLLRTLGVGLQTVYQPNQKPHIEGAFNKLWTYLSVLNGPGGQAQMGRYRGEMEEENRLVEKCRAGRADPRDHFPSLAQIIKALDAALAMHNRDTIQSKIYGHWVPELRFKEHAAERPWTPLPAEMEFLFAPYVRQWTVSGGSVGGGLPLLDDGPKVPFYFATEDLWRWNGRKVQLYFDPAAEQCEATIVSLEDYHGFRPGEVICRAGLVGDLTPYARASLGYSEEAAQRSNQSLRLARAACRRETRALGLDGQVKASVSEARDGQGAVVRVATDNTGPRDHGTTGPRDNGTTTTKFQAVRPNGRATSLAAPTPDQWARRQARLKEQVLATRASQTTNNHTEE